MGRLNPHRSRGVDAIPLSGRYHDAIAIALPAFSCGTHKHKYEQDNFWCLNDKAKAHLDATLANYELNGILLPGAANAAQRPGSSVAFVRRGLCGKSITYGPGRRSSYLRGTALTPRAQRGSSVRREPLSPRTIRMLTI